VAHTCNPSYSGGRDQDCDSKPAQANSSQDPILKNDSQKRAGGVAQGEGPEFKPQYWEKKKMEPIAATSEGKLLAEKLVHGDLSFFLLLSHLVMETW
jgi:hypothetical protein